MSIILVKWRMTQEDGENKVAIFTVGKWGSENTPELVAVASSKKVAQHLCELHNSTLR